jgi:hypothetical protein
MTDNQESGHNDQDAKPSENNHVDEEINTGFDVIELSDIAIGITPEDDAIVELTEEVIGEALNGFAGAVREVMRDDEEFLDLSENQNTSNEDDQEEEAEEAVPEKSDEPIELKIEDIEEELSRELDDYFEAEEETPALEATDEISDEISGEASGEASGTADSSEPVILSEPVAEDNVPDNITKETISVSGKEIETAVKRVIENMYSEKIDQILDEMIEKKVSKEIDRIKEHLINALKK